MANITKAELVEQVAAQAGTDKTTAAAVLKGFEETVTALVAKGEKVALTGFLTLRAAGPCGHHGSQPPERRDRQGQGQEGPEGDHRRHLQEGRQQGGSGPQAGQASEPGLRRQPGATQREGLRALPLRVRASWPRPCDRSRADTRGRGGSHGARGTTCLRLRRRAGRRGASHDRRPGRPPTATSTGPTRPCSEEVTAFDLPVTGTLPAELDGRYLRNGPNPFGPVDDPTPTTGSPATAWSTACACATAGPSGTATAGSAPPGQRGPRRGAGTGRAPRRHRRRQHQRHRPRRPHLRHRRGRRPARSSSTDELEHGLPQRLRRHPARTGSPPTPSATPSTGELHACRYYWARPERHRVHGHRRRRPGAPGRGHRGAGQPDGARHVAHRALRRRSTTCRSRSTSTRAMAGTRLPVLVERGLRRPRRRAAPRRRRPTTSLVRRRPLLRVPPAQRLRRRRPASCSTSSATRRCSTTTARPQRRHRRRCGAGPSTSTAGKVTEEQLDDRAQEFPRVDERVVGRRHRYGAREPVPRRRGHEPTPSARPAASSATTSTAGTARCATSGAGAAPARPCSSPAGDDAAEDDGWLMAFVSDAAEPTARPGHPRRRRPRPATRSPGVHLPARVPLRLPRQLDPRPRR